MTLQGAALLVDFDLTASLDNVAEMLLARFARNGWSDLRARFHAGEITLRQYQERAFALVSATTEEMAAYAAKNARLRPGFGELVASCSASKVPVAVVSGGLDFYVEAVLSKNGLGHLPCFSTGTRNQSGELRYFYPGATSACWQWGNCKCAVVQGFRQDGKRVIYFGDGRNDACPAGKADFVFARSRLLEHCRRNGLPHAPLEDFHQVVAAFRASGHPIHTYLNGRHPSGEQREEVRSG